VIVYADAPELPMAKELHSEAWQSFAAMIRRDVISFESISFQEIIRLGGEVDTQQKSMWQDLAEWVERKIDKVCGATKRT